ncbi:hypothetical protein ES703_55530 [subsurface metagenome]
MCSTLPIKGRKNLYPQRAFLVSNHVLYLDPGIIAHTIRPRRIYFSALEKTNLVPGLGTYIRLLGAFPIPEENPLQRMRKALERALEERGLVHFFPEGELFRMSQDLGAFKEGVFLLSFRINVPGP